MTADRADDVETTEPDRPTTRPPEWVIQAILRGEAPPINMAMTGAQRQKQFRDRKKWGIELLTLTVPIDEFAAALMRAGFISADERHDKEKIERAGERLIEAWIRTMRRP